MIHNNSHSNLPLIYITLLVILLASSCSTPTQISNTRDEAANILPTPIVESANEQSTQSELTTAELSQVLSAVDAREAVVVFIIANHAWERPDTWVEQSTQPIENAGVRHTFTSGPWVVQVEYQAAAPLVPEYHVTVDHLSLVARWVGTVNADGEIFEEQYISK